MAEVSPVFEAILARAKASKWGVRQRTTDRHALKRQLERARRRAGNRYADLTIIFSPHSVTEVWVVHTPTLRKRKDE